LNAETDSGYITSLKATNTSIEIDNDVVGIFVLDFDLEPKAQSQEKDKVKGGTHILVS
jgi:hypothetical protein